MAIIRKCIKCSGEFESKGPTNRLCKKCNLQNRRLSKIVAGGIRSRVPYKKKTKIHIDTE